VLPQILSRDAYLLFAKIIALFPFAAPKARISVFHGLDDLIGRQLVVQLFRKSVCAGVVREKQAPTGNRGCGRSVCHLEKITAVEAIAVLRMS